MSAQPKPSAKPGYKSTEFWASIPGAAALIETAQSLDNPWVQGVAVAGAAVLVVWYTTQRTALKRGGGAA